MTQAIFSKFFCQTDPERLTLIRLRALMAACANPLFLGCIVASAPPFHSRYDFPVDDHVEQAELYY